MRRMTTTACALESPDLGGHYRLLEHVLLSSRNFLEALEVRNCAKNKQNLDQNFEILSNSQKIVFICFRVLFVKALFCCA